MVPLLRELVDVDGRSPWKSCEIPRTYLGTKLMGWCGSGGMEAQANDSEVYRSETKSDHDGGIRRTYGYRDLAKMPREQSLGYSVQDSGMTV